MARGKLISFEGSEGCGKSTQIPLLVRWLQGKGITTEMWREPGGTPLGEKIRHLLMHDHAIPEMRPETELFLFAASRAELVRTCISPALEQGKWVIADRYMDSTTIYQGIARGLPPDAVEEVNRIAVGNCAPDLTLYLDLPIEESKRRLSSRAASDKDRIESQPDEFFFKVREGYRHLVEAEPHRIKQIDASPPPEILFQKVISEVEHAFFG